MSQIPPSPTSSSAAAAAETPRSRRGTTGCLLGCITFAAALVIGLVIAVAVVVLGAQKRVDAQLDELRASGTPVTAQELETRYLLSLDEEQNTAELWIAACAQFEGVEYTALAEPLPVVGTSPAELPPPGTPWDQLEQAEAFLQKYQPAMQMLHQAAERGGSALFPHEFSQGFAMQLPFLQQVRNGGRMLKLEAYVHAHRGNAEGATDSLVTMWAASRALEHENSLVGQLVRHALESMVVHATLELLPQVDFTDEQLADLQELFRDANLKDGFREAVIGERVAAIMAFEEHGLKPRAEDLELYLQLTQQVIESTHQPWPVVIQTCHGVEAELTQKTSSQIGKMRYMVTATVYPATSQAATAMAAGEGQRAVADVLLAAQRYHLAKGEYPRHLEEMVPDFLPTIPYDPLDGQLIRYELRQGFPVAWSIGIDLEDDGGKGQLANDRTLDFVGTLNPTESGPPQDE
mgnify:FL=1